MKHFIKSIIVIAAAFITATAQAQVGQFIDMARVISVQPMMEQVQQRDCSPQQNYQSQQNDRSNTGGILGGIVGGLLGSQVGGGNGRIAAAAVGGVVGAMTGDRMDNRTSLQQNTCQMQQTSQLSGYLVTFEYNGRQGQKKMSYNPGQTVRVLVSVDAQ